MNNSINVDIKKNKNENNVSIIKRFQRKVQESGVLQKVRSKRYLEREKSQLVRKNKRLVAIQKTDSIRELIKMGKMPEQFTKRRR